MAYMHSIEHLVTGHSLARSLIQPTDNHDSPIRLPFGVSPLASSSNCCRRRGQAHFLTSLAAVAAAAAASSLTRPLFSLSGEPTEEQPWH